MYRLLSLEKCSLLTLEIAALYDTITSKRNAKLMLKIGFTSIIILAIISSAKNRLYMMNFLRLATGLESPFYLNTAMNKKISFRDETWCT